MSLKVLLGRRDQLDSGQLVATLLKAADDGANQATLKKAKRLGTKATVAKAIGC